jgi:hypothetical protein
VFFVRVTGILVVEVVSGVAAWAPGSDAAAAGAKSLTAAPNRATLATFAGVWSGHSRALSITRRGRGVEQVNSGCCCPCFKLVFQLTQPRGTQQIAAATATVIAIHAPGGTYAVSRPLPHVGQRWRIQLRDGQLFESLTGVNYCGPHAKGFAPCGA